MGSKEGKKRGGNSMVAAHPDTTGELKPVENHADEQGLTVAELAGLRRATGWAPGKEVTAGQFAEAVETYRNRPMGGGRI